MKIFYGRLGLIEGGEHPETVVIAGNAGADLTK